GWTCSGVPSVCTPICGDGQIHGMETCDDANGNDDDGCSAICQVEPGWTCMGTPTTCFSTCGDGIVVGTETCDDGNSVVGDCCDASCNAEPGCEIEPNQPYDEGNDFAALQQGGVVKALIK